MTQARSNMIKKPHCENWILFLAQWVWHPNSNTNILIFLLDDGNRSLSHYPIYMRNHLYNTNPFFDYGQFILLEQEVVHSNRTLHAFAFMFTETGQYVFSDSQVDSWCTQNHFFLSYLSRKKQLIFHWNWCIKKSLFCSIMDIPEGAYGAYAYITGG